MVVKMQANAAWGAVVELAASRHGVFRQSEAAERSITGRQIRAAIRNGFVSEVFPRVFRFGGYPKTWEQRALAATLIRPNAFLSHASAARQHGLTAFAAASEDHIHITYPRGRFAEVEGIVVHRWREPSGYDVTNVGQVRCWSLPACLVQLGVHHDLEVVRDATLEALGRGMDPRWMEQTWRRMNRPGVTGLKVLLEALALPEMQGVPVESVLELVVERFAADAGLPNLERQIRVETSTGRWRIDGGLRDVKLGLEATSFKHHFGFAAEQSDSKRHLSLAAEGWQIEYITWWMTRQPEVFADLFLRLYLTRRRQLGLDADPVLAGT